MHSSLIYVSVGITISAVGINMYRITAENKKNKLIIKKKRKKYNKVVLLGKDKLNTIEVLISKALIDSHISNEKFVSVSNALRELWNEKRNKNSWKLCGICYIKTMETYCVSCKKYTANKNSSIIKTKQNRLMLLPNYAVFCKKKSTFVKNKELRTFD